MKKITLYLLMFFSVVSVTPIYAADANVPPTAMTGEPAKEMPAEVKVMMNRLEEIKNMDKTNMSRAEKKALRKEVRAIKGELRAAKGGVYLSVGAIIIIILLLILLL